MTKIKKIFTLLFTILSIALTGCGSDIDLVKNGTMNFNQTTTLGKVLDNWKSCKSIEWEEFETDNGVKVVQFTCEHKIDDFIDKVKDLLSQKAQVEYADALDIASRIQTFQFTINQNNTFQIDNVQVKTTWNDGTSFGDSQDTIAQLETAYANDLNFDPSQLNKTFVGKGIAEKLAYFFLLAKAQAK